MVYPGQVTRIRMQFNTPGQYVWHCHIVEHEDNEMMRPTASAPFSRDSPEMASRTRAADLLAGPSPSRHHHLQTK